MADEQAGWRVASRRLVGGLGLGGAYGLALGVRYGALAMVVGALGVPLGFAAVAALGAPAFYIGISHANQPVTGRSLAAAVSKGVATAGLVLAGLAPAVALLSVSAESQLSAALVGIAGLSAAGGLGLRAMMIVLQRDLARHGVSQSAAARLLCWAFVVFAAVLAARVWWLALPMLGRAALQGGAP